MVFLTTLWYTVWFKVRITGENLQCGKAITVWGRLHSERFTEERTHGHTVKNTVNTLCFTVWTHCPTVLNWSIFIVWLHCSHTVDSVVDTVWITNSRHTVIILWWLRCDHSVTTLWKCFNLTLSDSVFTRWNTVCFTVCSHAETQCVHTMCYTMCDRVFFPVGWILLNTVVHTKVCYFICQDQYA